MFTNRISHALDENIRSAVSPNLVHRLFPAKSWVSLAVASAALLLLGPSLGHAAQVTETFTGGLGNWTTTYGLTDSGYNLGWANTSLAGGPAGEVGGLIVQTNSSSTPPNLGMPRILDTVSFAGGNNLDLTSSLSVSGNMYLDNVSGANENVMIGYFNTADPSAQRLGLRIDSPSGGAWRFRFVGPATGSGTRVTSIGWETTVLSFEYLWTPTGGGAGTISGSVTDGTTTLTVTSYGVAANTSLFDSFGIWVDSQGSTVPSNTQNEWFDNITYTVVPEPSAALLLPLGAGLLLLARRNWRRA